MEGHHRRRGHSVLLITQTTLSDPIRFYRDHDAIDAQEAMEPTQGPEEEIIQLEGSFKANGILVHDEKQAKWLNERGYGTGDETVMLSVPEALFLMETRRLKVSAREGRELIFEQLLRKATKLDRSVWHRYLILRDLRSRGYVTREGYGLGTDFNVYEKGTFPTEAKFLVVGLSEGSPIKFNDLINILKRAQSNRKMLVLAVIDRRSEVVYYSISRLI